MPPAAVDRVPAAETMAVRPATGHSGMRLFALCLTAALLCAGAAMAEDAPDADTLFQSGADALNKGDDDGAIAAFSAALRLSPSFVTALVDRGFAYARKKHYADAIADFDRALALVPDNVAALDSRGRAHAAQRDFALALADYDRVLELSPNFAPAWIDRGNVLFAQKRYDEAIAGYSRLLALVPGDPVGALTARGDAYGAKLEFAKALADYDRAIALAPKDPAALLGRAILYNAQENYAAALADIAGALALQPDQPGALTVRGVVHANQNDFRDAMRDFAQVLDKNPADPEALNGRCYARARVLQALDGALADCNAALKESPDDAEILDSRGFVYFRMGKFDLAKADYDRAIAADPLAPTLYKRGILKNRTGEGGKEDIAAALALDPRAGDDMTSIGVIP